MVVFLFFVVVVVVHMGPPFIAMSLIQQRQAAAFAVVCQSSFVVRSFLLRQFVG